MRMHVILAAAVLAMPGVVEAQGVVRGAQEGAAQGHRAAGPVGGAVGGAVGGVVGGVGSVLGIPQGGARSSRDAGNRTDLSANQLVDQAAARTAKLKAELRLTPEQDVHWPILETALSDVSKRRAERIVASQTASIAPTGGPDLIEQMRQEARAMTDSATDRRVLADSAAPLYATLNDQQRRRLSAEFATPGR